MATLDVVPGEVVVSRAAAGGGGEGRDADPILTEVVRHALDSVAAQMKISLRRAAFSPIIYEMVDFAAAIYDRRVRLLAQAEALPLFMGTLNSCIEECVAAVGGEEALAPGDVLLTTFGYHTGSHPQDMAVVMPVFDDRELVGYAAVKAHQMDIGAKDPYLTDAVDNLQEGLIVPGVKLFDAGTRNEALYRTIVANSRMPVALVGDLAAQVACCHTGARGFLRLVEKYGLEAFSSAVERMFDHGEALMRAFLERIPDGRYTSTGTMDSNGVDDDPIPFEISVEVRGGECVVDFTRAPATQAGPTNCPLPGTVSLARLAIVCLAG
ncbi:MAG TPA: hydantoinase B/oxoprolinase family protein, partial [Solirubrobacterales bacterium]|nr:hydantoinase B/oxoprolinase family protein [Solirubrobacterales bacterium]